MKKIFIYASVIGLIAGVVYWVCKKRKSNDIVPELVDHRMDSEYIPEDEEIYQNLNVVDEMYKAKGESINGVYVRHQEAASVMKNAYENIMEDFVDDFSGNANKVVVDEEDIILNKKIDKASNDLDDLLK